MKLDEWQDQARCSGRTETFFSERSEDIAEAKAICRFCPARIPCLSAALERREAFGVWGGRDSRERKRMLREATRAS